MTGLTDRTLRSYQKMGLLHGTNTKNGWRFSAEEVGTFLRESFVRQAMESKDAVMVQGFLEGTDCEKPRLSVVWERRFSEEAAARLAKNIADWIPPTVKMRFRLTSSQNVRVILQGDAQEILRVLNLLQETA